MDNLALVIDNENNRNVTYIHNNKFVSFYDEYIKSQRSQSTSEAYNTDLVQFFKFAFDKDVDQVRIKDIKNLTSLEAMKYHNYLKSDMPVKIKNATIIRKIQSVKSFMSALKVDYQDINDNIFDNIKLEGSNLDKNSYGNLDWDEAFLFIEYAYIEQMAGNQMSMLLKIACITSIRLNALLSLDLDQHFRTKIEKSELVNYIDIVDKGTRHQTPISKALFDEIKNMLGSSGKLFPDLYPHKVGKFLKQICQYFEIDERRNIKFHSFKKCGVNRILDRTGDLTKAQIQGKHKSITTTQNSYIELKDNLTLRPSYTIDQEINVIDEVKHLTHSELLNALSKLSDSAQYELLRAIQSK